MVVDYNYFCHAEPVNDSVQAIRSASRQLVRELHLLDGRVLCCNLPLSQCHLVIELDILGEATASDLGDRLVLEKSTMSRLVGTLVDKGLVRASRSQGDRRARNLSLTCEGKAQARKLSQHAHGQVASAMEFLSPQDEKMVLDGLARYATALRYARKSGEYPIRPIAQSDNQVVAGIIRAVMTEFGAVGDNYSIADAEVDNMFEAYPAPESAFFVVESSKGAVLGCGGMGPLKGTGADVCELRKMYFQPELRGTGMGSKLLRQILDAAREAGYRRCYLETIRAMEGARKLYQRHGFTALDGPLGNTGHTGCNQHMILEL